MMVSMDELGLAGNGHDHMHVKSTVMHVDREIAAGMVRELTEAELNAQKAGVRALLVARLEQVWQVCEPYIVDGAGTGSDARMAELGLKVLDRLALLHEVLKPDRPSGPDGDVPTVTALRRDEVLKALVERAEHVGRAGLD